MKLFLFAVAVRDKYGAISFIIMYDKFAMREDFVGLLAYYMADSNNPWSFGLHQTGTTPRLYV